MIEISKELLSEVLKENIVEVYKIGSNPNFEQNTLLFKVYRCGDLYDTNIYELAHKCKEWAYNKGFKIISGERLQDINALFIIEITDMKYNLVYREFHKSEIEAIIKACEWILEKVSK